MPLAVVTLGEFVVARDPSGGLEVQTRHEPVVFGAGAHRATFTMSDFGSVGPPVVRVDGDVATGGGLIAGEIRVTFTGSDWLAAWPDGSTVSLHWFRGWFVQVTDGDRLPAHRHGDPRRGLQPDR